MLRKVRILIPTLFILILTSGCFVTPIKSSGTLSSPNKEGQAVAAPTYASAAKNISDYNPQSTTATELKGPSGNLSGSSISLPPGALAISTSIVVEESIPLSETSVAGSLGLRSDLEITPVGSGLIIRPTSEVNLTKPLQITMPLSIGGGLRELLAAGQAMGLRSNRNYAVFYKYFFEGQLRAGVIPASQLTFTDNNQLTWEGYFGAYWLCETNFAIEAKAEVETTEPLVNITRVAVIEAAGYVPENLIAAKAVIPEVKWASVGLDLDTANRTFILKARLENDPKVSTCFADIFDGDIPLKGVSTSSSLAYSHAVSDNLAHAIKGRFRCMDAEGRLTISPMSRILKIDEFVASTPPTQLPAMAPPYFSTKEGSYAGSFPLAIYSADPEAKIYFSLDGSTPTSSSSIYVDTIYVSSSITVKAIAVKAGFANSDVASASYSISSPPPASTPAGGTSAGSTQVGTTPPAQQVGVPSFSQGDGAYAAAISVAISSMTMGANIYYTLDGSSPSTMSSLYSGPINISSDTTLKAVAIYPDMMDSTVATASYTFTQPPADAPNFSPSAGSYAASQNITLSSSTSGATIHYTLDGSTPTHSSPVYASPFTVSASTTVKAIAVKTGMTDSSVANASYSISTAADTSPPTVLAMSLNSSTINTQSSSASLMLNITVADNLALPSGLNFEARYVPTSGGTQFVSFSGYAGDALSGATSVQRSFQSTATLPPGSSTGAWVLSYLYLNDNLGNSVSLTAADLAALSLTTQFTNSASTADTVPPTVSYLTLSTATIDTTTPQSVTLDITVQDTFALPASSMNYEFRMIPVGGGNQFISFNGYTADALSGGTSLLRNFQAAATLPAGSTTGSWVASYLYLTDNLGNSISLNQTDLANLGFTPQFTNTASSSDSTAPSLTSLALSTSSVNTASSNVTVDLNISISDDFALPAASHLNYELRLVPPSGNQFVSFAGYTGDALSGATLTNRSFLTQGTFPQGSATGVWTVSYLYVKDNLGNYRSYNAAELIGLGFNLSVSNSPP